MNLRISDDVAFRDLEGEVVILNLATGIYFGLDPVGSRVWQLIGELGSTEKLIAALLDEYDVEEAELHRDLDELIGQLTAQGLLTSGSVDSSSRR